jgi:hypothetical protein
MLIKNVHETGWFTTNPKLDAPFAQHWAEWPMGGDLLAYTIKKGLVDATGDVPLTFNLFWLLTFPLAALVAFPTLRSLRCSWGSALAGAVLFSLAPYHFRNGAAHENLAFYVGIPIIVLLCVRILGADGALPTIGELRHRHGWWRLRWLLAGVVLVAVTGIYYLAFLLTLLGVCAVVGAIARRRPGRLAVAAILGGVGLAVSVVANLPTLLYRWQHAANVLGVPDRKLGVSEQYPLRLVELLSPTPGHRIGPLAALADLLYDPRRTGLDTAMLGIAGAIGLLAALLAVLVRASRRDRARGWSLEARAGIVIVAAILLGMGGGLSRALELVGLQGVRAWTRIAIVVAFAAIVVFCRLLDRARASLHHRGRPVSRPVWLGALALVVVLGVLDQASPLLLPDAAASAGAWHADARFVTTLERRLPADAMVFQLPVVDFPEHGTTHRMPAHDLIKEGYLHSTTLRWSAGGMRGRAGEWQWPTARLPMRELVRGVTALGFSALMLDRFGYPDDAAREVRELRALLGEPIARRDHRLLAWDLRPAAPTLLAGLDAGGRRALARKVLDQPRLYLSTDVDSITDRGAHHPICAAGEITIINPARHPVHRRLAVDFSRADSTTRGGDLTVAGRRVAIRADEPNHRVLELRPGTTTIPIAVRTPAARCQSVPVDALPTIAAKLRPTLR